ncbi:MAG: hypothetical protein ACRD3V_21380, partial [Vicinamibacteria bacterium]
MLAITMEDQADSEDDKSSRLYQTGRAAMEAGDLEAAVAAFRESVLEEPHFKTLELLGEALMLLGRPKEAIVPLAAASTLNRQVRAPALLAQAFLTMGRETDAYAAAEEALSRDANNRMARSVKERTDDQRQSKFP